MGCDGYILNPFQRIETSFYCYACGRPINESVPCENHMACITDDGRIPIGIERENYEPR